MDELEKEDIKPENAIINFIDDFSECADLFEQLCEVYSKEEKENEK